MELNNLLAKIKPQKAEEPKKFLALELTDSLIQAATWHVRDAQTEVVKKGSIEQWDIGEAADEALLAGADKSISLACQGMEAEPTDVIFGIPYHWVVEDKIDPIYLARIKKVCQELGLKPLGFVVILESLIKYLKIKEGVPPTAVFAQVEDTQLTVALVRLGKVVSLQTVGRSDDICEDLEEALSRFPSDDNFPSRIILFDSLADLEDLQQALVAYDWQERFPFLHLPKIETLEEDIVINAVCIAGGSEVAKSIGFEVAAEVSPEPSSAPVETESIAPPAASVPTPKRGAEALGFFKGVDVAVKEEPVDEAPASDVVPVPAPVSPPPPQRPPSQAISSRLSGVKLPRLSIPRFSFKLPGLPGRKSFVLPLTIAVSAILLIGGSLILFTYRVPKAALSIFVDPRNLEEALELRISPTSTVVDKENLVIPGYVMTRSAEGKDSVTTSGKKTVGDKATGEVTVFNRTPLSKTLKAGTEITADKIAFKLDSDVTIASSSSEVDDAERTIITPGKAKVKVTAASIGADANFDAGKEFTVNGFSKDSYSAKNEAAFTGGSSREVQVVAEKDKAELKKTLIGRLTQEVGDALRAAVDANTGILADPDGAEVTREDYSAKVGDEEDSLTLDAALEVALLTYKKSDIESLISQEVESAIPQGFVRADLPLEVETSTPEKLEDGSYQLDAKIKVKLLPVVDAGAMQKRLTGKGAQEMEDIVKSVLGFKRAEVVLTPTWLPPRLQKLPRNSANISILIRTTP